VGHNAGHYKGHYTMNIGTFKITRKIKSDDFVNLIVKVGELESLCSSIKEQPIYPDWREEMRNMEFFRAVQGTVALEGSDIKLEDVEKIAEKKEPIISDRDKEVNNVLEAYKFIEEWSLTNPNEKITEAVIRQIHTFITRGISYPLNKPGEYRNKTVSFGYPRKDSILKDKFEVQEAMKQLIEFINSKEPDPSYIAFSSTTKAIFSHYLLTLIHPFIEGNGRVARAVEALILYHIGKYESFLFPINAKFYYHERERYFDLLRQTDKSGDTIPFILFAIEGLRNSSTEVKKQLLDKVTHTLVMDYAHQLRRENKLLKRQVALLDVMYHLEPMTLSKCFQHQYVKLIYHKISDSTRKRDFSKLIKQDFLKFEEEASDKGLINRYLISVNWDVLKDVTLRLGVAPHRPQNSQLNKTKNKIKKA
jgi:Fic family protein